jgi:hypothetical protein
MAKKPIPAPTTINGFNGRNGHVSLAREEYEAFVAREEVISTVTAENAKLVNHNLDLTQTCDAQVKHLSNFELKIMHLERINGLQSVLIDLLKDKVKVASLEDLSEFWRQWTIHTSKDIDSRKVVRDEVAKFEPNLFKTWRNWTNDSGGADRSLSWAGTRAEREAQQPNTPGEMHAHTIRRLREENVKLMARTQQLESEIEALKGAKQQ